MASLGTCLCICSLHREAECLRALYSSEGLWKRRENLLPLRWMHPQNSYYFCLHGTFDQPLVTYTPCLRQVARWGRGVWVAWCLCLSLGPHHLLPGSTVQGAFSQPVPGTPQGFGALGRLGAGCVAPWDRGGAHA